MEVLVEKSRTLVELAKTVQAHLISFPARTEEEVEYIRLLKTISHDFQNRPEYMVETLEDRLAKYDSSYTQGDCSLVENSFDSMKSFLMRFQPPSAFGVDQGEEEEVWLILKSLLLPSCFGNLVEDADQVIKGANGFDDVLSHLLRSPVAVRAPQAPPSLYIYKLEAIKDRLYPAPILGPWIDTNEIRRWLDHCDNQHRDHCTLTQESAHFFQQHPQWLIDVNHMCLIPTEHQRYLALSYVWGRERSFQTLKNNLGRMRQYGSLRSDLANLPRTISDIIELCQKIGERYLWIDALCIVQDDDDHRQDHLRNMSSIYANAYATIVAAGGPAHEGLRGIEHVTPPMERTQYDPGYLRSRHSSAYSSSLHLDIEAHHQQIEKTVWNHRAWTFQEQIFSRRLIIFTNEDVSWECHCSVMFEHLPKLDGQCLSSKPTVSQGFREVGLSEYSKHLEQYNRRALTYPEDALDAFSSILSILERSFHGGFISGLPVQYLDKTLLWYNETPLKRRVARRSGSTAKMPPSWSWAAWEGGISLINLETPHTVIKPIVKWHHPSKPQESQEQVALVKERIKKLQQSSSPNFLTPLDNLLYARPMRAYFSIEEIFQDVQVLLEDGVGMLTSCLRMYDTAKAREEKCEVVAVSEMSVGDQIAYNVVWIGWSPHEKDTAYRKGVGRVLKSAWPADGHKDCIDLFLA